MERIGADTLHFLHYYSHMAQLQAFPLALPLGELSPKVTERALQALLNGNINLCTHAAKIPVDVSVGKRKRYLGMVISFPLVVHTAVAVNCLMNIAPSRRGSFMHAGLTKRAPCV